MRIHKLLTGAFMAAVFTAVVSFTAAAAPAKGRFYEMTDSAISGWAYDSDKADQALNVHITIKEEATGQEVFSQWVNAGQYSKELYEEHKGNGCHAFRLDFDWDTVSDGVYRIEGETNGRAFSNNLTYTKGNPAAATEADNSKEGSGETSLVSLGVFKTTGYCPCRGCSEGWGRHTSTGAVATAHHTIAVDPRVIPYGSRVMINGTVYTAEDRGGGVKGNHIDIFFDSHAETRNHGVQNAEVFLLQA